MNVEIIFFFLVAALAIVSAVFMITRRNPVKSVLFLIVNFFCLAVVYLILHAQFIAIIQILVYAGAIMVLFLFVIMLLNLGDESRLAEKTTYRYWIAAIAAGAALVEIALGVGVSLGGTHGSFHPAAAEIGTVEFIGRSLYSEYLFPFEVTSLILLAAMVGVIVLAKKKFH
ncbi:MAG: NADH-quinone oxidoreductase subunit J [Ignavibacteria bacterium]|nr:NADH-quinone oxidoreductase subunit J [Ignavibacteria bacterium]